MLRHQLLARVGQRLGEVSLGGELGDHRVKVRGGCLRSRASSWIEGRKAGCTTNKSLNKATISGSRFCLAKTRKKLLPKAAQATRAVATLAAALAAAARAALAILAVLAATLAGCDLTR